MKKLVSFLLVLMLVLSVTGTAFADGMTGASAAEGETEYTMPEIIQNPVGGSITKSA